MTDLERLLSERAALVLWDVSEENIAHKVGGQEMAEAIRGLLGAARACGIPRIWSQHQFLPATYESLAWREHYARRGVAVGDEPKPQNAPSFMADPGPIDGELVLQKSRSSFFVGTLLRDVLANLGARVIVVCGASTDTGVTGTARDAITHGLVPIVVRDAVAANSREISEQALAEIAAFAPVATAREITTAWLAAR